MTTLATLDDLLNVLPGAEFIGSSQSTRRKIRSISTDTRSLKKGDLFLAITGENFDGHAFVDEAARKGAQAAIVSSDWNRKQRKKRSIPLIVVRDTLDAFGEIAAAHRRMFNIPVVAVAGASGKTSTKDLITTILSRKFNVLSTPKNHNNRIGVPTTILHLNEEHDVAVIEIGTNMPGEIGALCKAIEPTHGVITNIGYEHLERLGSLAGVAREEGALFHWLRSHRGVPLVNIDDEALREMGKDIEKRVTYGRTKRADVQVKIGKIDQTGAPAVELIDHRKEKSRSISVQLQTPGVHTGINAAAATATALVLKVPVTTIAAALKEFTPPVDRTHGYARLALIELADGGRILNDTYNANPDSMKAALETLVRIRIGRKGKRIAVLGDMAELGPYAPSEHENIGKLVQEMKKIDVAIFFGRHMRRAYEEIAATSRPAGVTSFYFRKKEKLIRVLKNLRTPDDVILVKGSRSMQMEEIVAAVEVQAEGAARG